jgi:hypothetical protein
MHTHTRAAVIRYDLEYLSLCPCMVDVEIIDAKNDNQSIFVSAGLEACVCSKVRDGARRLTTAACVWLARAAARAVAPTPCAAPAARRLLARAVPGHV